MIRAYAISGMRCQNCVEKVTKAIEAVPGVAKSTVTLVPPEARVDMASDIPTSRFRQALREVGDYALDQDRPRPAEFLPEDSGVAESSQSLLPLFVILGYLVGGVLLRAVVVGGQSLHSVMENFMGGFFVIFSLFKMINLRGFAEAYATYDIIAKRSRVYAMAYPFIELGLGALYLTGIAPLFTNLSTVALMAVSSVGVAQVLGRKQHVQCACLGTALNLPMTKVTLLEDVLMGVMALSMLAISF